MEFLPIPELPKDDDRGRWNLFNALKDGLQKVIDAYWLTDNPWVYPYLLNSWQNYGEPYSQAGYRLDGNRLVHFIGVVKAGTPGSASIIFELPMDLRPAYTLRFPIGSDNESVGTVSISKHGAVIAESGCSETLTSLDGIIFRV
jgi:hypothetical protein